MTLVVSGLVGLAAIEFSVLAVDLALAEPLPPVPMPLSGISVAEF